MAYFFTSDEHYGHARINMLCARPFDSIEEMDEALIANHNSMVTHDDVVFHIGDFTLKGRRRSEYYQYRLNGTHHFIEGSHDSWMHKNEFRQILEVTIEKQRVVLCHYPMRAWRKSHLGSWLLHGHTHAYMDPIGKQYDVGVDNNEFFPWSWDQIKKLMATLPETPDERADIRFRQRQSR